MPNDPQLPPDDFDDDALDDEFPDFDASYETQQQLKPAASARSTAKSTPSSPTESLQKENSPIEQIDISHIPLKIQLEVARISVSLEELQKMKPGSKLPIDINPRIVNLVVGGKSIGQGEIVEIGDIVGVKILELYK